MNSNTRLQRGNVGSIVYKDPAAEPVRRRGDAFGQPQQLAGREVRLSNLNHVDAG
jgi:hypothetical protein